jgi:hypothetical protein
VAPPAGLAPRTSCRIRLTPRRWYRSPPRKRFSDLQDREWSCCSAGASKQEPPLPEAPPRAGLSFVVVESRDGQGGSAAPDWTVEVQIESRQRSQQGPGGSPAAPNSIEFIIGAARTVYPAAERGADPPRRRGRSISGSAAVGATGKWLAPAPWAGPLFAGPTQRRRSPSCRGRQREPETSPAFG